MGALDAEISHLKGGMIVHKEKILVGRVFSIGTLEGEDVVLVKAGVGKVNAALTAQILIESFDIQSLIFTGVAGGIDTSLHVGDIVISSKVIQHDYGLISPDGFHPLVIRLPQGKEEEKHTTHFLSDSLLIKLALTAVKKTNFPESPFTKNKPKVVLGVVVTGDQFIASEEKRKWLEETFQASCVEMEGGAVAQICTTYDIPFVILRSLSDLANEEATIDFEKFVDYASKNSTLLVLQIVKTMEHSQ